MCEADERNQQALYELRGMAQEWVIDLPRIIKLLTGEPCRHEEPAGSFLLPKGDK